MKNDFRQTEVSRTVELYMKGIFYKKRSNNKKNDELILELKCFNVFPFD